MKKRFASWAIAGLLCITLGLAGCKKSIYADLAHTWTMPQDQVTLKLNADSTFSVTEKNVPHTGRWKLADDEKYIIFTERGKGEKRLKITSISDTKLELNDNGLPLEYQKGD